MNNPLKAIEYCMKRLATHRGMGVHRCQRVRDRDVVAVTLARRSFEASTDIEIPTHLTAAIAYDLVAGTVDHLDTMLRSMELRTVFDFNDDDQLSFVHVPAEERRRIGAQLLRVYLHLLRGDTIMRERLVEAALALGRGDRMLELLQNNDKRQDLIDAMPVDEAERIALELMKRVERLGRGAS